MALDSYSASFLSDESLKTVLGSNVFLDGEAATILCKRGFLEYIGIEKIGEKQKVQVQSEVFTKAKRSDDTYIRMPSRVPINCWYDIEVLENAEVLSQFMTPVGKAFTGMTYFENSIGGRVVIFPAFGNWGTGFFNHTRVALFKDIFKKLWPDMVRIDCDAYTLAVVKEKTDGKRYYFLTNFSADTAKKYKINGKTVEPNLRMYQSVVYEEIDGELKTVGKSAEC